MIILASEYLLRDYYYVTVSEITKNVGDSYGGSTWLKTRLPTTGGTRTCRNCQADRRPSVVRLFYY